MKKIKLTQGKFAVVDDRDFNWLNQWKWFYHGGYAKRNNPNKKIGHIFMHRIINRTPQGKETDHVNRNRLDNRRKNLRTVNRRENVINANLRVTNTSGHKGVTWEGKIKKWRARVWNNYKTIHIGVYGEINDAIKARKEAEIKYYG